MTCRLLALALFASFGSAHPPLAQSATTFTETCKDGSAFSGATRSGACRGHGGVQSWNSGGAGAGAAPASTQTATKPSSTVAPAAAGSAADQVRVNTASKVCSSLPQRSVIREDAA